MKVINKELDLEKEWRVGDVIEFQTAQNTKKIYVLIIKKTGHMELGDTPVYTTVVLNGGFPENGGFPSDIGVMRHQRWEGEVWVSSLDVLKKGFKEVCYSAKVVPFYGVVGKPEED